MSILNYFPEGYEPSDIQKNVLRELELRWDNSDVFVLNLDVSTGKSWIAYTIAKWQESKRKGTRITTPTSILVDQYSKDFPKIATIKSAGHYSCELQGTRCGSVAKKRCSECVYTKAYNQASKAKISFSTYHMSLALRMPRPVMVFDEAHKLSDAIRNHHSSKIWAHKLGIPREIVGDFDALKEWLGSRSRDNVMESIYRDLTEELPNNFYTWSTDWWSNGGYVWETQLKRKDGPVELPILQVTPLDIYDKPPIFWDKQKLVLMSATIGRPDLYELGLDRKRPVFIEGAAPIAPENRPIIKDYIGSINYSNEDQMLPKLAEKLSTYLKEQKGRGVIHITYKLAAKLKGLLPQERLITHRSGGTKEALGKLLKSEQGVMLACGMYEGVSLDYDKADWQSIAKISWPSLIDPLQKHRSKLDPDYYNWSTLKVLIQASGRNCRRPDDRGVTFINDASFEKLLKAKHLVPKNFSDRIVESTTKSA